MLTGLLLGLWSLWWLSAFYLFIYFFFFFFFFFFLFVDYPVYCLNVVFGGSCLALVGQRELVVQEGAYCFAFVGL